MVTTILSIIGAITLIILTLFIVMQLIRASRDDYVLLGKIVLIILSMPFMSIWIAWYKRQHKKHHKQKDCDE